MHGVWYRFSSSYLFRIFFFCDLCISNDLRELAELITRRARLLPNQYIKLFR